MTTSTLPGALSQHEVADADQPPGHGCRQRVMEQQVREVVQQRQAEGPAEPGHGLRRPRGPRTATSVVRSLVSGERRRVRRSRASPARTTGRGGAASARSVRSLVDVGDGDRRVALAQPRHEGRRGEAVAAEGEEVGVVLDRHGEDLVPEPEPASPAVPGRSAAGPRPAPASSCPGGGQGSALRSTFPEVRVGIVSTTASTGTSAAGSRSASAARASARSGPSPSTARYPTRISPPAFVFFTAAAAAVTRGRASSAASISPSSMRRPPSLTWSSARPTNSRPALVGADEVAAVVGPRPAQRRHRPVLLGVLRGVEVAAEARPADHQLAGLARGAPGSPCGIDDRELPAVAAAARSAPAVGDERRRARDDRGLGRPVGVPHLPAGGGQPLHQLGRARLAAEDQQPDPGRASGGQSAASVGTVDTTVIAALDQPRPQLGARSARAAAAPGPGTRRSARPATSPRRRRRRPPTARPAPGRRARAARRAGTGPPPRRRTPRRSGG